MTNKLCGNCKHWVLPKEDYDGPYGRCGLIMGPRETSKLNFDPHAFDPGPDWNWFLKEVGPAHVEDASGYFAALKCAKDFGCVLWTEK